LPLQERDVPKKTLIFIPTYNEGENVEPMCERLLRLALGADIVFMDDASPDGTGDVLDALARKHPAVSVIHRAGKLGIGSAHLEGIAFAYDHGYRRLVTLDADFTHTPEKIPAFLARAESSDVVIGSRHIGTESLPGWSVFRKALTKFGHVLTERLLGMSHDATGAFRVYNLETIPRELFGLVQSRGYAFFFESLLILYRNSFSIAEVPIKLPARSAGHSKMSFREIERSVKTLFELSLESQRHPERFLLDGGPRSVPPPDG
jgi:dolichol-phosphate mannosyltransferase